MSPKLRDYFRGTFQLISGQRIRHERGAFAQREEDISPFVDLTSPLKILDLANGRLRPQYLLLHAAGHNVVGIDLTNRPQFDWTDLGYRFARWLYGTRVNKKGKNGFTDRLVCGDAIELPLPSDYFEVVTSIAAFEHFMDVPSVVTEVHRVLQPGGIAWIGIHPFTSLSGGHNLTATEIPLRKLPLGIEPWDHLRKREIPITVPLNEWRIHQYLEEFSKHFEILKNYCAVREGKSFLTKELEIELVDYSRDELTCLAYIIVARKYQPK